MKTLKKRHLKVRSKAVVKMHAILSHSCESSLSKPLWQTGCRLTGLGGLCH